MRIAVGIAASQDPAPLAGLGAEFERLGLESAWCNDSPAGEGLLTLASWARGTGRMRLGVGVMALDRHSPRVIADRVRDLDLASDRVLLGLGAGFSSRPLGAVREGVAELRALLPNLRIIMAAMGPRMCRLAGEVADGALLNWMTPERTDWARQLVHEGATEAGRDPDGITIYGYVRVAVGAGARERLQRESTWYAAAPHYARHFEAMGTVAHDVGETVDDPADLHGRLNRYTGLDVVVARILSERDPESILAVARAAVGQEN
ncbi:MAG: LLM class flavin-dependent oxidoreductase [Candidatus Dormibacteria bacterium]